MVIFEMSGVKMSFIRAIHTRRDAHAAEQAELAASVAAAEPQPWYNLAQYLPN